MSVLKRPIITEKVTAQNKLGKYAFEVDLKANKIEIAKAVEKLYGVTVKNVATMRCIGRHKSRSSAGGRLSSGYTSTFKKAIVTLTPGEVIDIYGEA